MATYVLAADGTTDPIFTSAMTPVQNLAIAIGVTSDFDGDYLVEGAIQDAAPWWISGLSGYAAAVPWFEIVEVTTTPVTMIYPPQPSAWSAVRVTVSNWVAGSLAIQVYQTGTPWTGGASAAQMLAVMSA